MEFQCQAQSTHSLFRVIQNCRKTARAEAFGSGNNKSWKPKQKRNSKNTKQCSGKSRVAGIKAVAGVGCVLFSRCAYHSPSNFNIADTGNKKGNKKANRNGS